MDIKKLITRIEKIKYENLRYNSPESMLLEQKHLILDLVEQFDEQQKPVVPEFVAEWIEYAKKKGDSLRDSFKPWNLYGIEYSKADRWIDDNQETFAQAWLSGYEVEKEPMYYVILSENKGGWKYTFLDEEGSTDYTNNKAHIPTFTEKEIKGNDERFWPFAVPVEEG